MERLWVPSHYQRFLIGYPKEALFEHVQDWRDHYHSNWDGLDGPWWGFAGGERFIIRNSHVEIETYIVAYIIFATINHRNDSSSLILYVMCVEQSNRTAQNHLLVRFDVGGTYRLTLRVDGDYMDFFVNDDAEPITTLVGVNEQFREAVNNFFNDRDVNTSRIIWPRRADGSMDFPPPDGVTFWADHATPAETKIAEAAAEQPESASETEYKTSTPMEPGGHGLELATICTVRKQLRSITCE